jgi:hypothetical protein
MFPIKYTIRNSAFLGKGVLLNKNLELWHCPFMHTSVKKILQTRNAVHGLNVHGPTSPDHFCERCILGKLPIQPYTATITPKSDKKIHTVSFDLLIAPKDTPSLAGATAFLGISAQGHESFKFGYAIQKKGDLARHIAFARKLLERITHKSICERHADGAGENTANLLIKAAEEAGITVTRTTTENHRQNTLIERWFRSALDAFRAQRAETGIPANLWAEGIQLFCYLYNCTDHDGDGITPYEYLYGRKPTVADFRVPFCLAYARILPGNRTNGKFGLQAVKGRLIGFAYYYGQPEKHLVIRSCKMTMTRIPSSSPKMYSSWKTSLILSTAAQPAIT